MATKQQRPSQAVDLTQLPPLPPGWCWTTLESVADIEGGITKDQKKRHDGPVRDVPYLRVANVQRGFLDLSEMKSIAAPEREIEALRLVPGDILFTEGGDRDKLGRGWVWGGELAECIHQNHIFRARPCLEAVVPKFVSMHGNFFGQQWFTRTGKQTTNLASINKGVLRNFPVPVAPLDEQRRIVTKVEELFSDLDVAVATLERVQAKLKRYRAAVLKAAIDGNLTADWRARHPATEPASALLDRISAERRRRWEDDQRAKFTAADKEPPKGWQAKYPEPVGPETAKLPLLTDGWCWASMDQLLAYLRNGLSAKPQADPPGQRILRINAVRPLSVDLEEVRYLDVGPEASDYLIDDGDLLFTRYNGSVDLLGVAGLVRGLTAPTLHPDKLIRAKPVLDTPLPEFLELAANAGHSRQHMRLRARTTAGQTGISGTDIREMPVPLPPLSEQAAIVEEVERRLSVVDQAAAQVDTNLKRAARLRQGILKRAFEGKLVPQIATDEPASVLLDRIRQQRTRPTPVTAVAKPGRRRFPTDVLDAVGRLTAYLIEHAAKPLGRKAKAKLLYFTQVRIGIPIRLTFQRWDHGPFDPAIPAAERKAQGKNWFKVKEQKRAGERTDYQKTDLTARIAAEAEALLGDRKAAFDDLIALFNTLESPEAELLATVYAAWNDLLLDGRPADEAAITAEVYGWHPSKRAKFAPEAITRQIAWMRANGYVPTGTGERTTVPDTKPKPTPARRRKPS